MNTYENAPATRMLATHCCVCRRPLLDAKSVEIGMGPDCRKKHGYDAVFELLSDQDRVAANKLVHDAALKDDAETLGAAISGLHLLGFVKLASIIIKRRVPVVITLSNQRTAYLVKTPFSEAAVRWWHRIPGRRWDRDEKVNVVPVAAKDTLWALLKAVYPGQLLAGPQGIKQIPGGAQ